MSLFEDSGAGPEDSLPAAAERERMLAEGWRPFPGYRGPDSALRVDLNTYVNSDFEDKLAPVTSAVMKDKLRGSEVISQEEYDNLVAQFNLEKGRNEASRPLSKFNEEEFERQVALQEARMRNNPRASVNRRQAGNQKNFEKYYSQ